MENTAKENLTINKTDKPLSVEAPAHIQFRKLIFSVLNQLKGAWLEVIEGNQVVGFGEKDAALSAQIIVRDSSFYKDVVVNGSIGASEAFLDQKWTSPDLTKVVQIMAKNQDQLDKIENNIQWLSKLKNIFLRLKNANTETGAKRNILAHYDIGNDLYQRFLDPSMQYSSAIYSDQAQNLAQAQQNKMRTICERLGLTSQDHVVEIGTGWGGLAIYMAQNYGCKVTTTTISDAQYELAQARVAELGLDDRITLLKQDYRALSGQYDKLVSIEMIESVGHEYLATFFATCSNLLKPDGKMLIQSITIADNRYDHYRKNTDFIQKHIFPGGCLPSLAEISRHVASSTDMVIHQVNDIGFHYARTLKEWRVTFESHWSELKTMGYSEEFKRLWLFYLCYCEGAFLERVISTQHIVARKPRYRGPEDETILDY
ncbi:class I SAM-dependent methyltransferase [Vibrio sinensis]|uniref:Class I SAM-dependent methyltransferase n=1 Tax=Vibrio sinensis TaxID=2302434 RepID=A0A3A6RAS7_9VIBR|nr:cyclopropane-fatty-acyl-phospholipid synthase family protein [Vibrio sinensis]RJX73681.1 class I SAM-dependent methyltransferase [Vibrio sinensis]